MWEGLRIERRGDRSVRAIEVPHAVPPQRLRDVLAHSDCRGIELLHVEDAAWLPLDALARPSLRELRVAIRHTHYLADVRPAAASCDVRGVLRAMPQLERLAVSARVVELADSIHPALQQLVLVVDELPSATDSLWPSTTVATLVCTRADVERAERIVDAFPALEQLTLRGDGAGTLLEVLPERVPSSLRFLYVHGDIALPLAQQVVVAPGRLAEVERVHFEASGSARMWLDCLTGKPAARERKRTRVQRWVRMFAQLDALPPSIVVDGSFAWWPQDPIERELRASATDRETALVYADWLEQHGHVDAATALRGSPELDHDPQRAMHVANEEHRESFREATLVLLEAWRRQSPYALATGEPANAFRGRMHAKLMAFSFARDVRRDEVPPFVDPGVHARLGAISHWVLVYEGVVAIAAEAGYGLVVDRPESLHPDHQVRAT